MAEVQIQSISHRHRQIADWLLMYPHEKNLQKLCNEMNISRSWLSIVMQSDVFKEYFDKRRNSYETEMQQKLLHKQLDLADKALDKLSDIVADDDVDDRLVFDIANNTVRNLGFTPSRGRRATVTEEHVQEVSRTVDANTLAAARETIRRVTRITSDVPALPPPDSE